MAFMTYLGCGTARSRNELKIESRAERIKWAEGLWREEAAGFLGVGKAVGAAALQKPVFQLLQVQGWCPPPPFLEIQLPNNHSAL